MSDIAIRCEGLSKQYRIGKRERYRALRDVLTDGLSAPFRALGSALRNGSSVSLAPSPRRPVAQSDLFWALDDVSFSVSHGEVVGIIGRNGAGKSTLLKILSRITEPTRGFADINGRVGSLLEVGTGFHPELTGRENIYLNGAILGMKRAEIERRFDEIVAFAETEKFLDTPVKYYSSGMQMRLAFAVAAHLDPEILLVDEVLAVGDAQFQKKCLGKMGEVAREGRTVMFVSHNMAAVQQLCDRGVVLTQGRVHYNGDMNHAVEVYLAGDAPSSDRPVTDLTDVTARIGSGKLRLTKFWVEDENGETVTTVRVGAKCSLAAQYVVTDGKSHRGVTMTFSVNTMLGAPVFHIHAGLLNQEFEVAGETGCIYFDIPKLPLVSGRYVLDLNLALFGGHEFSDYIRGVASFEVADSDFYDVGNAGTPSFGPALCQGTWRHVEQVAIWSS